MKINTIQVAAIELESPRGAKKVRINRKRNLKLDEAPTIKIPEVPEPMHPVSVVEAHVNLGWGNVLFIRGEGGGLSWEQGIPLACLDSKTWVWLYCRACESITFKLLINDKIWSLGENRVLEAGGRIELAPRFA